MNVPKVIWRPCYELLAARVKTPAWAFMNYGFAPTTADVVAPVLDPLDEADRLCIQLYDHVLGTAPLTGKDVLEVGCGRGGGAAYIARYRDPSSTTGLDFSERAVALCTRDRRGPGLSFISGDAQSMPFPEASFDVVVNVESSHCYNSVSAFLAEVARVLRPGGTFRFADLRTIDGLSILRAQLEASGLTVVAFTDITANVLAAMRLDSARKLALIRSHVPRVFRAPIRSFAGLEGTANFSGFQTGRLRYVSAELSKEIHG